MFRVTLGMAAAIAITACASPPDRENSEDIKTTLSPGVIAIADAEGGVVDTDKHTNVRCERIKIVGTHIHERLCYTKGEEEEIIRRHQDEYYRQFGAKPCRDCENN